MAKKIPNWIIYALLVISFIGFVDATYLTVSHLSGGTAECILGTGCDKVLTSEFSAIGPIPVALFGSIFYLSIFFLSLLYLDRRSRFARKAIPVLGTLAFLASLCFIYLQLYVIQSICTYCMLSALSSTLIFLLGLLIIVKRR